MTQRLAHSASGTAMIRPVVASRRAVFQLGSGTRNRMIASRSLSLGRRPHSVGDLQRHFARELRVAYGAVADFVEHLPWHAESALDCLGHHGPYFVDVGRVAGGVDECADERGAGESCAHDLSGHPRRAFDDDVAHGGALVVTRYEHVNPALLGQSAQSVQLQGGGSGEYGG